MKFRHGLTERVRRGDPIPLPLDLALRACTPAVRAGMALRRLRPTVRLDARVISYGNITAGGTGKTPAVIERVRQEADRGHTVGVLTRGYGSPSGSRPCDSPEIAPAQFYEALGDEAALILRKIPECIVLKDADRVAAGRRAIERYGCDTLVLDDGFQYVRLAREEDIALVDATNPFGDGRLIPRGILREPVSALRRATGIVVTRADQAEDLDALLQQLARIAPGTPVRTTRHAPVRLTRASDSAEIPLDELRGREVVAACGIGNPESFAKTLRGLGGSIREIRAAPDHHALSLEKQTTDIPIVITEKDAVRASIQDENVWILEIELQDWPAPS